MSSYAYYEIVKKANVFNCDNHWDNQRQVKSLGPVSTRWHIISLTRRVTWPSSENLYFLERLQFLLLTLTLFPPSSPQWSISSWIYSLASPRPLPPAGFTSALKPVSHRESPHLSSSTSLIMLLINTFLPPPCFWCSRGTFFVAVFSSWAFQSVLLPTKTVSERQRSGTSDASMPQGSMCLGNGEKYVIIGLNGNQSIQYIRYEEHAWSCRSCRDLWSGRDVFLWW